MANKPLQSIKFPGLSDTYTTPQVDATLTTTGAAADAKKVGDEITDLKQDLSDITEEISETIERKIYTPIAYNLSNKTVTRNGITFTQATDETIVVSGTATANAMYIPENENGNNLSFALTGGKTYRLKGCPSYDGADGEKYRLDLRTAINGGSVVGLDKGDGAILTIETSGSYYPFIRIGNGTTVDLTFTPEVAEESIIEVTGDVLTAVDAVARADLNDLEETVNTIEPFPETAKIALLNCFAHVAWIDEHGQEYYDALQSALTKHYDFIHTKAVGNVNGVPILKENMNARVLLGRLTGDHPVINESGVASNIYFVPIGRGVSGVTIIEHIGEPTTENEYPFTIGIVKYVNSAWEVIHTEVGASFSGAYVDISDYNDGSYYLWANIGKWNGNYTSIGTPAWSQSVDLTNLDTTSWILDMR